MNLEYNLKIVKKVYFCYKVCGEKTQIHKKIG